MLRQSREQLRTKWMPVCWLMTDARLGGMMPRIAARTLPPRSGIIIRPHALTGHDVALLSRTLRRIARARRHLLLWGGRRQPPGFDGVHDRYGTTRRSAHFVSRPVHNRREALRARRLGSGAVLVSPVYPTRSHAQAAILGRAGFARLAAVAGVRAIALGGMTAQRFVDVRRQGAVGWAAIDVWLGAGQPRQ